MAMGKKLLFLSLLFLIYLSVLLSLVPDIYLKEDSYQYIILAQSIKAGHGYRMLNFPGEPFCEYYPLLWPALLSIFIPAKAFAIDMTGMLNIILLLGCFFAYRMLFKKYIDDKSVAFWCWIFFIFNPYFIYLKTEFLSEPLFLLFLAALFLSLERHYRRPNRGFIILAGSLAGLCYLTRHIAIVLFIAVFFYLILKSRQLKEASLFGFSFLLFYLPWEIAKIFFSSPFSGNPFGMLGAVNPYNPGSGFYKGTCSVLASFLNSSNLLLNDFTLLIMPHSWPSFLRFLLLGFLILGVTIRLKKGVRAGDFFAAAYLFGLAFWPYTLEFKRLLLPILPFFLVFVFEGLKKIVRHYKVRNIFLAVFFVLFIISNRNTLKAINEENVSGLSNLVKMCFWIKDNVKGEPILFATNPARVSFFTQKKAFYFKVIDPAAFAMLLERFSVEYVLYNDSVFYDRNYLYPLLKFFDFEKVVNIEKCYLYRVK